MNSESFEFKKALGYNLSTTFFALGALLSKRIQETDLNLTQQQAKTLLYLGKHEGIKQQSIADMMQKDKPAITKMIDHLENKGLVKRVEDKEDRRNKLLYLTAKGKKIRVSLFPIIAQVHKEAQGEITNKEMEAFIETIRKIKVNIITHLDKKLPF